MRVLIVLTYYRPHVSGLTIYAERLAQQLVARGHRVTVLCARHDRSLPSREVVDGIRIVRVPVLARISKGVVMPMPLWAFRQVWRHDAVSVHLPQFDGGAVAMIGRLARRRTVVTHHCDLRLPTGLVNRLADLVTYLMNLLAGLFAHVIVAYTEDYAKHSSLLRRFRRKIRVCPPPVVIARPPPGVVERLRATWGATRGPVIGMAARLATEKGVEYLVRAMPLVLERFPDARVVFAGAHADVVGEARYRAKLTPGIDRLGERWRFVGELGPDEMADFFGALDVLVVSSVNSTESFGLVQVEAMLCGTPVVASDLPGVRQPVAMTGMGVVVPPADPNALAAGLVEVVADPDRYVVPRGHIRARFDVTATTTCYEDLLANQSVPGCSVWRRRRGGP
ncbi:MAG: glycosyltransferase family 4 protein [Microthrixaceae bacterium]|nr:glycosyltransferase family 4 protein [Microthrixaceae bacterium]